MDKIKNAEELNQKIITIIGVSAIGKTTMGRMVSERIGFKFKDLDLATVDIYANNVDEAIEKYGQEKWNELLWNNYRRIIGREEGIIVAVSPRILNNKEFWKYTKKITSIHLIEKPLIVLKRKIAREERISADEVKISDKEEKEYLQYYKMRMRQCKNSNYSFIINSNLERDVEKLSEFILNILSKNKSIKNKNHY